MKTVNPARAGALFGLAVAPFGAGVNLVDDALNNLELFHEKIRVARPPGQRPGASRGPTNCRSLKINMFAALRDETV